jgi:hypothetical protein
MSRAQQVLERLVALSKDFATRPQAQQEIAELVKMTGASDAAKLLRNAGLDEATLPKVLDMSRVNAETTLGARIRPGMTFGQGEEIMKALPKPDRMQFERFYQEEMNKLYRTKGEVGIEGRREALLAAQDRMIDARAKAIEQAGGVEAYEKSRKKTDDSLRGPVAKFAEGNLDLSKQNPIEALSTLLRTADVVTGAAPLRSAVAAGLSGEDAVEAARATFRGERQGAEGGQIAKNLLQKMSREGLVPKGYEVMNPETGEMETKQALEGPLGILADIALDPTNLTGVGGAVKTGASLINKKQAAGILDNLLNAATKSGKKVDPQEVARAVGAVGGPADVLRDTQLVSNEALERLVGRTFDKPEAAADLVQKRYKELNSIGDITPMNTDDYMQLRRLEDSKGLQRGELTPYSRDRIAGVAFENPNTGKNDILINTNRNPTTNTMGDTLDHELSHIVDKDLYKGPAIQEAKPRILSPEEFKDPAKVMGNQTTGHHLSKPYNHSAENVSETIEELLNRKRR